MRRFRFRRFRSRFRRFGRFRRPRFRYFRSRKNNTRTFLILGVLGILFWFNRDKIQSLLAKK